MPSPIIVERKVSSLVIQKLTTTIVVQRVGVQGPPGPAVDLVIGTIATRNLTVSPLSPSGGQDTDIWFKYVP